MIFTFDYDHDVDAVFELLSDPQFVLDRSMELGDVDGECEVEDAGDEVTINQQRVSDTDLPKILEKIVNSRQYVNIVDCWKRKGDGWQGNSEVSFKGQPLSAKGKLYLEPTDTGCQYRFDFQCKAKVPLVGGKIEKFLAGKMISGMEDDHAYTVEALG